MAKRLLACLLAISMLLGSGLVSAEASSSLSKEEKEDMLTISIGTALLKVDICDADIVRVRYFPEGEVIEETLDTFTVDYDKSFNDYDVTETDNLVSVTTAKLRVLIDKTTGKITYYDAEGNLVLEEKERSAKVITLDNGGASHEIAQSFVSDANEALYGFGNINSTMGIKGQSVSIRQTNTEKRSPMFYSNMGYGILFDIVSNGQLDWSNGNSVYKYTGKATDSMDYFFFYGPDADTVISGYRTVTGTATLLPKNAYGYVQSRNRYGSQKELQSILDTFREKQIPLDGLVIDYHWWEGSFGDITNWESVWTDPEGMMDYLHENNVTASISVWPSFTEGTEAYNRMDAINGLLPTVSGFGNFYDASNPDARDLYWSMIEDNVFSKGLDSIWLDACEPEYSNWASNHGSEPTYMYGNSKPIGALYPLLTNRAVYEGQRAIEGNTKRVNSLSRGSVAGLQRYGAQSWSGDIPSTWASLEAEVSGIINYSASGIPYFGTDIGGYHGFNSSDPDSREMYLRWIQLGTFMTIMRSHGAGNAREPWQFGSTYESYITDYIYFRERLVPYIYSLAGAVTQEDYTIIRPLIFDFRTDDNVKHIKDQYMFGPSLMVAPVTSSGQRSREVYLPAGTWTNFWTGETIISEGQSIQVSAPVTQIPLFVRGGSILPLAPEVEWVDQVKDDNEIRVYMGADGSFNLYEDEGNNYNYEEGKFSNIPFTYDEETKTLTIGKRTGSFDGMVEERTFRVVFVQPGYGIGMGLSSDYQDTAIVAYDGSEVSVTFDGDWDIPTPPLDTESLPTPDAVPEVQTSDNAMVGYWSFWEGEGAKVSDSSGYFNNGGLNMPNWTTEGKVGNAITFSGGSADTAGTAVSVGDSDSLDVTTAISFSAWVKNESTNHANIVNKGGNGNKNPGYSFILYGGATPQLEIQTDYDASRNTTKTTAKATSTVPNDGEWHQVGFTWKSEETGGDGIVRIYIDGVQVSDDTVAGNYFAGPIGTNTYPLVFGRSCENEPNYPNYFKGVMDEPSLYNYALTAEEMAALNKGESIVVENPTNAAVSVADGSLTVTWEDASTTDQIVVTVESVEPDFTMNPIDKTFTLEKGVETLTVDGLQNGEYYYVGIVSVDADGRQSQGVNMIARVGGYPVVIDSDYVVNHGEQVYAWIENNATADVTGTLTVALKENGTVKETLTQAVSIAGNDRLQFTDEWATEYATGQTVTFTLKDADGNLLAAETTVDRSAYYVAKPTADKSALQTQLKYVVKEENYTEDTLAAYKEAYKKAKIVDHNSKATQEEVNEALAALKEAKKNLKRKSTDNIVMTFSKSEGSTSNLLSGNLFYIDWKAADGVPGARQDGDGVDLSGIAENGAESNLHLKATVIFTSPDPAVDPADIWKYIRFRLRSSFVDDQEKASDFVVIKPDEVLTPDVFEVDIPLSSFGAGKIDWTDVKELIIQCEVASEYRLESTGESSSCCLTLADIWIENVTGETDPDTPDDPNPPVDDDQPVLSETTNLVLDRPITVTASAGHGSAEDINDNDRATFWDSGRSNLPATVTVDLGWRYALSRVELLLPDSWANDRTQEMEIQISDDGETFTTVVEKTGYFFSKNENGNIVTVTMPENTVGRYLRVIGYSNNEVGNPGAQLGELRAFGRYVPDEEETTVDFTALNEALDAAETVLADGKTYSAETKAALDAAMTTANALLTDETATQEQVDAAVTALNDAVSDLQYTLGDVNADGDVTAEDALLALQAATQKITLDDKAATAANVDGEIGVAANDALQILQYATKKIANF